MMARALVIALIVLGMIGQTTAVAQNDGSFSLFIRVEPVGARRLNVTVDATANSSSYDPQYSRTQFGISVQVPQEFSIGFPQCVGDCSRVKRDPVSNTVSSALLPLDRAAATLVFGINADAGVRSDQHFSITARVGSKSETVTFTLAEGSQLNVIKETATQASVQLHEGEFVSTQADSLDVRNGDKITIEFHLDLVGASDFGIIIPDGISVMEEESGCIDPETGIANAETKYSGVNCGLQSRIGSNQSNISGILLPGGSYHIAVVLRVENIDQDTEVKVFAGSPRTGYDEISIWLFPV